MGKGLYKLGVWMQDLVSERDKSNPRNQYDKKHSTSTS
jgi:hypothetical protein